jgi:PAS domain S-box-containing protein
MVSLPDIVKILRQEEKQGKLKSNSNQTNQELEIYKSLDENPTYDAFDKKEEDEIKNIDIFDNSTSKNLNKVFSELMEIINFTEKLSTSLYGDLTREEIIEIVINEFKKSGKYTGSILLLTNNDKLEIAGTSSETKKLRIAEKISGHKINNFKISLDKSKIYSQVIYNGKTIDFKINDLLEEILPKKIVSIVAKTIKFDKNIHVATPLKINGKIIGAFAMSSTMLHNFFIPSVKNLALNISHSFEHAKHFLEKECIQNIISQSEQIYRSMIETAPLGIFTVNTKGIVTSCNDAFIKMAGYSRDELVGKNITNFPTLIKKDIPKYMKIFKSIISGEEPKPFKFNWKNKSGEICTGKLFISLIRVDKKVTGIQAIIEDLSKTQEAKLKLKDAEERYNSLFEGSMDIVYICDFKGQFIDANKSALNRLGYNYEDIKSLHFSSILEGKELIKAFNVIRELKKYGYQKSLREFKIKKKNGEYIYVESISSLLYSDGKPYAIQGIARDITERKFAEFKIKNRSEDLELINHVNNAINTNQSLDEIFTIISNESGKIFNSYNATIYLISDDRKYLVMKKSGHNDKDRRMIHKISGFDLLNFKISLEKDNIYSKAVQNLKPVLINDRDEIIKIVKNSVDNKFLKKSASIIVNKLNINSIMITPLINDKKCIGLIDISRDADFSVSDIKRLDNIAKQLTVAIDKIILKESKEKSEEKYRDLYESLRDASAAVSMDGKITEYNSIFLNMLGYSPDELSKLSYEDITPKKWHKIEDKIIQEQVLTQGYSELYEKEYIRKDGKIIPIELTTYLLKDNDDNPTGMRSIIRDISERKKTEKELKDSREYFQTLFNTMIDPVAIVDHKGKILELTNKVGEITGYGRDELIGKNFLFVKFLSKKTKALLIEKLIKRMAGEKLPPYEIELKSKYGEILNYEINAEKIDYFGKKADMVIFRDVKERKKAEQRLRESEENYRNIVELAPDGIITVNIKGVVNSCNTAFSRLSGFSKEEIIGKPISHLPTMRKRDIPKYIKLFSTLLRGGKQKTFEFEWVNKDGDSRLAEARASLLKKGNKIIGMQAIIRDITEQKKAEKELQDAHEILKTMNFELERKVVERTDEIKKLLKQKDEFINQLGHDLKNPLSPVTNLLPLIKVQVADPKTKDQLNIVMRNVDFMKNLVIKTIELAKLSSPNTEFLLDTINLSEEINDSIEKNKTMLQDYNIEIITNIDNKIIINADKLRLSELFDNIITNAVKYSPNGGSISFNSKDEGKFIKISIKDSGIGLTQQQKEHIFDEFYKVDKSRHDFESSGLGLTICKRIVEKHGGSIWAESPGHQKGTTINFTLPKVK